MTHIGKDIETAAAMLENNQVIAILQNNFAFQ